MPADDDMYSFAGYKAPLASFGQGPGPTPSGGPPATASSRPMTSSAGFKSSRGGTRSGTRAGRGAGAPSSRAVGGAEALEETAPAAPEDLAKGLENEVMALVAGSVAVRVSGAAGAGAGSGGGGGGGGKVTAKQGLDLAKRAGKKERELAGFRSDKGLDANFSLVAATYLNLALAFESCGKDNEATKSYKIVAKSKDIPAAGRFRINIGRMHARSGEWELAVKNYRMALDQIPVSSGRLRSSVLASIGAVFVKEGKYQEATSHYEQALKDASDMSVAYNLLLCHYAMGSVDSMRAVFRAMLAVKVLGKSSFDDDDDEDLLPGTPVRPGSGRPGSGPRPGSGSSGRAAGSGPRTDGLRAYERRVEAVRQKRVLSAAKLIAPHVGGDGDAASGFDFIIASLKGSAYARFVPEVQISKAMHYIGEREFATAIKTLKGFAKAGTTLAGAAATNISFLYFLERDYAEADAHATLALEADHYNAKALVNKGNCLYVRKEFEKARELYIEALNVEADCTEALYNLGLVNTKLGLLDSALHAFEKLNAILPNTPEVLYNLANILEMQGIVDGAIEYYTGLLSVRPHDAIILARLGQIYDREGASAQAYNYFQQSYAILPSSLDTLAWLGAYCVEHKKYDTALTYFERAARVQPDDVKWRLWMASCHRKLGGYQKALGIYKDIHAQFPNDIETIQYLERICREMSLHQEADQYALKLQRLTRGREPGPAFDDPQQHRPSRAATEQYVPEDGFATAGTEFDPSAVRVDVGGDVGGQQLVADGDADWSDDDDHLDDLLPQ